MIDAVSPVGYLSDSDAGPGREVYYALTREKEVRKIELSAGVKTHSLHGFRN